MGRKAIGGVWFWIILHTDRFTNGGLDTKLELGFSCTIELLVDRRVPAVECDV